MLHPVTGSKQSVLTAIDNATVAFTQNNQVVQEQLATTYPDPVEREHARQQIIAKLKQATSESAKDHNDPKWFSPRDPMAALAQSAMNTAAEQTARQISFGIPAFEQFGTADPGWIECIIDGFKTAAEGKAPFVQHANLTDYLLDIPDTITIALVADWGAANDASTAVAKQIRDKNPDITIHLGDIYYAGQDNEVEAALKLWPMADPVTGVVAAKSSFALNGNHEMFSGGKPYFKMIQTKFGQPASYFGLRNSNWQLLAFDTAYVEHRLLPESEAIGDSAALKSQWNWLVDKVKNSNLSTIFLSHHQPVSAFNAENTAATKIRQDFEALRTATGGKTVFGWFFGHEHQCTIYDDNRIPYFARLIGNGCIPHSAPPPDQKPEPGCFDFHKMNSQKNAKGDAVSGFALLSINGADIHIQYINEDGTVFNEEFWDATAR